MSFLQAALLGLLQGLTEFLPVSSSGHLVLVPALVKWPVPGLAFTVAVHMGTLLAVVVYYRREWKSILADILRWLRDRQQSADGAQMMGAILLGTVPAAVVGLTLESNVERMFNSVALVGVALSVTSVVLFVAETLHREKRHDGGTVAWWQAIVVGLAQAAAVVPGLSRSGMTIAAGLLCGLPRDLAARYAFLLSVPVILGAGAKEAVDLAAAHLPAHEWAVLALGAAVSAVSGLAAIYVVVRAVHRRRLRWFGIYCLAAALVAITMAASGR